MTNADRIRQMTDEQLAEWFAPYIMCDICDKNNKPDGCNLNECNMFINIDDNTCGLLENNQ